MASIAFFPKYANFGKLLLIFLCGLLFVASNTIDCKAQDDLRLPPKFILVSVPEQRLTLWEDGRIVRRYRISTSKFGLSNRSGSYGTPLGWHTIAAKIGDGVPVGGVFKNRVWTGEVLPVNAPGRDPIVTRILWLSGEEWHNSNSYDRKIYIHGTPEESTLGINSSYGCVRMASRDVIDLYDRVHVGTPVLISLLSTLSPEVRLQVASYWRYAHSPSFAFQQREPAFSGMREAPPVP